MKMFIAIYFLLSIPSVADTTDDARLFLSQIPPVRYEAEMLGMRPDAPQYKPSVAQTIRKQLEAIAILSREKKIGDVTLLIPFLDYTENPDAVMFPGPPKRIDTEDVQETKANWPVFAAILDNPNAARELEAYITNQTNPLDTRLAAWTVLRYLDKDKFNNVSRSINVEIKTAPISVRDYVSAIERGDMRFHGIDYPELALTNL